MSGNCLFYNESHYYVLMTVGGCIIYTQIVLRKNECYFLYKSFRFPRVRARITGVLHFLLSQPSQNWK